MANKQKQMLAVWGSPGAGKTVTAVKLAAELAKRKNNVVLVFTDLTAPPLPAVAAEGKLPEVSVGELLSAPGMTQEQVLKTCVPCEKHPYISFLGYKAGENVFTYAEYSKEKAVDMLVLLRHIADYVIVDCTRIVLICQCIATRLNRLVKNFIHTVYVRFGGDYRSKIL